MDWLRQVLKQATASFRAMTAAQRASMVMLGLTIAVALGLVAVLGARQKYVAVASNLDQTEIREAAGILDQQGIEYKLDAAKGAILVASDRQPAAANLLRRSEVVSKDKIFDKDAYRAGVGGNIFMSEAERAKQRRDALGGELRKMISGLDGVETCRVVITDEAEGEFNLTPEKVGVSVTVTPRGGKKIDQPFANSVIDLVSSAVGNCDPGKITVIDTRNPARQFHREDADTEVAIGNKRLALSREIEQHYQKKIGELIASMHYEGVGIVTCRELDLDKVKKLVQTVKPDETVVVYQKTHKLDSTGATGPGGPTGVDSNNPVAAAGTGTGSGSSAGTPSKTKDSESETKTICSFVTEEIQKAPGQIAKMTASVVINRRLMETLDKKTGKVTQVYDEEPNDQVKAEWKGLIAKVMGIEKAEDIDKSISLCFWKQPKDNPGIMLAAPEPGVRDMVAAYWPFARVGGVLMLTAVAFLFLYALGKRAATAPPPEVVVQASRAGSGAAAEEEGGAEPDDVKLRQLQDKLRGMVTQDPRKVATLVKRWLTHEG